MRDFAAMVDLEVAKGCEECEETGLGYEWCGCFECEYTNKHGGDVPCGNCQHELIERLEHELAQAEGFC